MLNCSQVLRSAPADRLPSVVLCALGTCDLCPHIVQSPFAMLGCHGFHLWVAMITRHIRHHGDSDMTVCFHSTRVDATWDRAFGQGDAYNVAWSLYWFDRTMLRMSVADSRATVVSIQKRLIIVRACTSPEFSIFRPRRLAVSGTVVDMFSL